jgi:hypothetical protein
MGPPPNTTYNEFAAPPENYSYQAQVAYAVQPGPGTQAQPNQAQPRVFATGGSPYQGDGRNPTAGYGVGRATTTTYYGESPGQSISTTPIQPPNQQQTQYSAQRPEHVQDPYYGRGAYTYRPFLPIPSQ